MRRNLLLAETLSSGPTSATVLLVTGSREISRFRLPKGVDVLSVPALYKDSDARYQSRSLNLALDDIVELRSTAILGAVEAFDPDVMLVDNVPRGACNELDPTLSRLRRLRRTRLVLGLRDILDEPAQVRREWAKAGNVETIRRTYDAIWVYGDRRVSDVAAEYGLPLDLSRRIHYVGYLDQRVRASAHDDDLRAAAARLAPEGEKMVLCLVGGGQDGSRLSEAFAGARFAADTIPVLVTGPMMSAAAHQRLQLAAGRNARLRVLSFVEEPAHLIRRASAVIAMGGYNTVCDLLSYEKPALIVPRVTPRTEQLVRAERLAARGLVDMLHPDAATPEALAAWASDAGKAGTVRRVPVEFHTAERLHGLFAAARDVGRRDRTAGGMLREVRHAS